MRKLIGLLLALSLSLPTWPQAQPKPASSPTPQASAPQPQLPARVLVTITATWMGCVYIGLSGHKVRAFRQERPHSAGIGRTRSPNIVAELARIMVAWRSGLRPEVRLAGTCVKGRALRVNAPLSEGLVGLGRELRFSGDWREPYLIAS